MDEEMEVASSSSNHSGDKNLTRNPEKNFVKTEYRLQFQSGSSSGSENEDGGAGRGRQPPMSYAEPAEFVQEKENFDQRKRADRVKSSYRQRRRSRSRSREQHDKPNHRDSNDTLDKTSKENKHWQGRRMERQAIAKRGVRRLWETSPSHSELEHVFEEHEAWQREADEQEKAYQKKQLDAAKGGSAPDGVGEKPPKKAKKNKAKKKHKKHSSSGGKHGKKSKKRRRTSSSSSDSGESASSSDSSADERRKKKRKSAKKEKSDDRMVGKVVEEEEEEWVELTKELREEEAQRTKEEEAMLIGPQIPDHLLKSANSPTYESKLDSKDRKNMLRGEAAAMAAYAAQGKRIPRRGEIGLTSGEISEFEKVGYVMSGTRHKSMEATRMRKEDQILTAEEKRLLSNFSQDHRKNREDTVLNQFRELISSKKSKN